MVELLLNFISWFVFFSLFFQIFCSMGSKYLGFHPQQKEGKGGERRRREGRKRKEEKGWKERRREGGRQGGRKEGRKERERRLKKLQQTQL
jgi:hypothetical protein